MIITRAERKRRRLAAIGAIGGAKTGPTKARGGPAYYRALRAKRK